MAWREALWEHSRGDPRADISVLIAPRERFKNVIVIADKFPKSSTHWLVIPKKSAEAVPMSVSTLKCDDLPLLREMYEAAVEMWRELRADCNPKCNSGALMGFHLIPSLFPLHLHVMHPALTSVSGADFEGRQADRRADDAGVRMKTPKHWNSFTTSFFVPLPFVLERLSIAHASTSLQSNVLQLDVARGKALESGPLRCPACVEADELSAREFSSIQAVRQHFASCPLRQNWRSAAFVEISPSPSVSSSAFSLSSLSLSSSSTAAAVAAPAAAGSATEAPDAFANAEKKGHDLATSQA